MHTQNTNYSTRRYNVTGSQASSNYWWGTISLIGGFGFLTAGLYSYWLTFFPAAKFLENSFEKEGLFSKALFKNQIFANILHSKSDILFFPQGLSMCFYGTAGILLGSYLWFCIFFQVGSGFTEFNKSANTVRIFRLGFPGKNRLIDYKYTLDNIQCICVKIRSGIVPVPQRGVYMRLKSSDGSLARDIPLDLYSEKTSLEDIELQAADLSKFLQVSLSILV